MKRSSSSYSIARLSLAASFALALALPLSPARAQQSSKEIAAARQAFKDGEAAEAKGDLETALARFQAALTVKETPQLHLRIGTVEEKLGRLTSALASYKRGLERAASLPAVAKVAKEQIDAIEPKIPELTIAVAAPPAGLAITLDGAPVAASSLGAARAIDPGQHRLHAEAPGRVPFDRAFTADRGAVRVDVELAPVVVKPIETPSKVPGAVTIAGGAAALIAGAVLIGVSFAKDGSIDDLCGGSQRLSCPESRRDEIESGVRAANALRFSGIGAGVLGAAGVAVGSYLLVRAARPREATSAISVAPFAGIGVAGASVTGRF